MTLKPPLSELQSSDSQGTPSLKLQDHQAVTQAPELLAADPMPQALDQQDDTQIPLNVDQQSHPAPQEDTTQDLRGNDLPQDNLTYLQADPSPIFSLETEASLAFLQADLQRALNQEEFLINYQPIISLATGKVVGFETLLRWQHPVQGLMRPADFLANATETGLIVPIGWWVLTQACQQLKVWQQATTDDAKTALSVSVNLSAQQLAAPELMTTIQKNLTDTALEPGSLRLEIPAKDWSQLPAAAIEQLSQLRSLGVQLCLDQFNQDDTILPAAQQMPLDRLKLDRTLISQMEVGSNIKTIRTITTFAQRQGLEVIAVGIETPAQLALLQGLACQEGQGYYFSAPVVAATATPLVQQFFLPEMTPATTTSPIPHVGRSGTIRAVGGPACG